jgi:hypothetical protein
MRLALPRIRRTFYTAAYFPAVTRYVPVFKERWAVPLSTVSAISIFDKQGGLPFAGSLGARKSGVAFPLSPEGDSLLATIFL